MNPNQRIPLIVCIAFGICLGNLLWDFVNMIGTTLIAPFVGLVIGRTIGDISNINIFGHLKIGSFIIGCITTAISAMLLWFAWKHFALPQIKKVAVHSLVSDS